MPRRVREANRQRAVAANRAAFTVVSEGWVAAADVALAMAHSIPHAVVPQLLRPVVGRALSPKAVVLASDADVARTVTLLKIAPAHSLTEASVRFAARLPHLTALDLRYADFSRSAAACRAFGMLSGQLRSVDVSGSRNTAELHLAALPHLTALSCEQCDYVFALDDFHRLPLLESLNVSSCRARWNTPQHNAHLAHLTRLTRLDMNHHSSVDETTLAHVAKIPRLKSLSLNDCPEVSAAALAELTALPQLEILTLRWSNALRDPQSLHNIARITGLRSLNLGQSSVNDAGLAHLSHHPTLTSLFLTGCTEVGAAGVAHVSTLPRLRDLSLSGCNIGADALQHVPAMPSLSALYLRFCIGLDTKGLSHIARSAQLKVLDISHCLGLRPDGVVLVAQLRQLRSLNVQGCSNVRCDDLQQVCFVPNLRI